MCNVNIIDFVNHKLLIDYPLIHTRDFVHEQGVIIVCKYVFYNMDEFMTGVDN